MNDGKQLILSTKPFAKEILWKSRFHIGITLLAMVANYALIFGPTPLAVKIVSSLIAALLLVRVFIFNHDYQHNAIFKDSKIAPIFFTLFGWYILVPSTIWKRSHDYHHKHNSKLYTSSIGSFPIVTVDKYLDSSRKDRMLYLFVRHPLTIGLGYFFMFLYGMCLGPFFDNPRKNWDSAAAIPFHYGMGLLIFLLFGWQGLLLGFIIPALISGAAGAYLFYAQHNFPTATFADKDGWTYIKAAMESSSYMKMPKLMHWFTGNIGYHHIHHANARIPFYRLPEVYKKVPEFQEARTTSLLPWEIYRCFCLRVWDPAANKMITRRELRAYARERKNEMVA